MSKDTLRGSASLNWSTSRLISQWTGVTVSSSHVTELDLGDKDLTGSLPAALGDLSQLETVALSGNQLTGTIPTALGNLSSTLETVLLKGNQLSGCIPAALRTVERNDLAQLSLLFCDQTSGSAADEDPEPVAGESPTILYLPIIQK